LDLLNLGDLTLRIRERRNAQRPIIKEILEAPEKGASAVILDLFSGCGGFRSGHDRIGSGAAFEIVVERVNRIFVMAGLVPAIHAFLVEPRLRRGCPAQGRP
jgi:hypothetical protein